MWGWTVLIAVGVTAVHFVVTFLGMLSFMYGALGPVSWWARVLGSVWIPLGFPATFIIGTWTPSLLELSNQATVSIMLASSLLWGASLALFWRWWRVRFERRPR